MKGRTNTGDQGLADKSEDRNEGKLSPTSGSNRRERAHEAGLPETRRSSGDSTKDESLRSISGQQEESDKDLEALHHEELSGSKEDKLQAVGYSDTDEDEDEGLGDGNLGRSVQDQMEE